MDVPDRSQDGQPEHFTVEFGVKLGGETGIILAKGDGGGEPEDHDDVGSGFPASGGRQRGL
jgi:hypothetical protein